MASDIYKKCITHITFSFAIYYANLKEFITHVYVFYIYMLSIMLSA